MGDLNFLFPDPFIEAYYDQLAADTEARVAAIQRNLTPASVRQMADLAAAYPNLPAPVIAATSLVGAQVGQGMTSIGERETREDSHNVWDGFYGGLKGTARGAFTIFDMLWEEGLARPFRAAMAWGSQGPTPQELRGVEMLAGLPQGRLGDHLDITDGEAVAAFRTAAQAGMQFSQMNLSLPEAYRRAGVSFGAQALSSLLGGERVNIGSGWLPSSDEPTEAPEYGALAAQVGPQAATAQLESQLGRPITRLAREEAQQLTWRGMPISPGRVIAGTFPVEPGTTGYNILSGLVDAAAEIALDPSWLALKGIGQVRKGTLLLGREEAGLIDGARRTIFRPSVQAALTSERMQRVVRFFNRAGTADTADVFRLFKRQGYIKGAREMIRRLVSEEDSIPVLLDNLGTNVRSLPVVGGLGSALLERAGLPGSSVSRGLGSALGGEVGAIGGLRAGLGVLNDRHGWGRLFGVMGGRMINIEDLDRGLYQLDDLLISWGFSSADRSAYLYRWCSLPTTASADDCWAIIREAAEQQAKRLEARYQGMGLDATISREMSRQVTNSFIHLDEVRKMAVDEAGKVLVGPETVIKLLPDDAFGTAMPNATMISEFLQRGIPIPDGRAMRKAMGKVRRLVLLKDYRGRSMADILQKDPFGENLLNHLADPFMQEFWKPFTLLRIAWPVRVLGEEQVRMGAAGLDSFASHPLRAIAWSLVDADGTMWRRAFARVGIKPRGQWSVMMGLAPDWDPALVSAARNLFRNAKSDLFHQARKIMDPATLPARLDDVTVEQWRLLEEVAAADPGLAAAWGRYGEAHSRLDEFTQMLDEAGLSEKDVVLAMSDEAQASLSHRGEFFRGLYGNALFRDSWINYARDSSFYPRAWAGELRQLWMDDIAPRVGADPAAAKAWLISDDPGAVALRQKLGQSGVGFRPVVEGEGWQDAMGFYVDQLDARINIKCGGSSHVEFEMPDGTWINIDPKRIPREYSEAADARQWKRMRYVTDSPGNTELRELVTNGEWRGTDMRTAGHAGDRFDGLVETLRADFLSIGPEWVKGPVTGTTWGRKAEGFAGRGWDFLFDLLMSRPTNLLSRHPAFAQFYWQRMEELLPFMDDATQDVVLSSLGRSNLPGKVGRRFGREIERTRRGRPPGAVPATADQARALHIKEIQAEDTADLIRRVQRSGIVSAWRRASQEAGPGADISDVVGRIIREPGDGEEGLWALQEIARREDPRRALDGRMILRSLEPGMDPSQALTDIGSMVSSHLGPVAVEEAGDVRLLPDPYGYLGEHARSWNVEADQIGNLDDRLDEMEQVVDFYLRQGDAATAREMAQGGWADLIDLTSQRMVLGGSWDADRARVFRDAAINLTDELVTLLGPQRAMRVLRSCTDEGIDLEDLQKVLTEVDDVLVGAEEGQRALQAVEDMRRAIADTVARQIVPRPPTRGLDRTDLEIMGIHVMPGDETGTYLRDIVEVDQLAKDILSARGYQSWDEILEYWNRRGFTRAEAYADFVGPRERNYEYVRQWLAQRRAIDKVMKGRPAPERLARIRSEYEQNIAGELKGPLAGHGPAGGRMRRGVARRPPRGGPPGYAAETYRTRSQIPGAAPDALAGQGVLVEFTDEQRRITSSVLEEIMRHPAIQEGLDDMEETVGTLARAGGRSGDINDIRRAHDLCTSWAGGAVSNLLYDVSRRHQFMDAFRNVFPFGEAWLEILTTWTRLMVENPAVFRRAQQGIEGAREAGFFHTDESTGDEMFSFPAGGVLGGLFSQILDNTAANWAFPGAGTSELFGGLGPTEMRLEGRLAGLNLMTGQWIPGFGPLIQVPASHIMHWRQLDPIIEALSPWKGQTVRDWARERILPFGEMKVSSELFGKFFPVWMRRILTAYAGMDPNMERIVENTKIDVLRALILSGRTANGLEEQAALQREADQLATQLGLIRGIAQMVSPTGPEVRFYTHVNLPPADFAELCRPEMYGRTPEQRDELEARIAAAADNDEAQQIAREAGLDVDRIRDSFRAAWAYQSLANVYRENLFGRFQGDDVAAFGWFTSTFGMDPTLFATPKTVQVERRHTTYQGDFWAREHPELFEVAPLTAYYAYPDLEQDPFDYDAYMRQLEEESRLPLSADQWLARRNDTLGHILYEKAKADADGIFGERDTEDKTRALTLARLWIAENYPGYGEPIPGAPQTPSTASKIRELYEVWPNHPELTDSETGQAVKLYLQARDRAMQYAVERHLQPESFATAKACADVRAGLRAYATFLVGQYPEFAYLWTLVLQHELTDDNPATTLAPQQVSADDIASPSTGTVTP